MVYANRTRPGPTVGKTNGTATSIARWLCLAAAPTFAFMAILTLASGGADMTCSAMQGTLPVDGMTTMYLLMAAFHLPPWLRMMFGRTVETERH